MHDSPVLWTLLFLSCTCRCTVDLNIHEIQYIADHLQEDKCRQLAEILHSESYTLTKLGDGAEEPKLTCIELLVLWDQTEGKNKTFHHLTHRLRQIGEAGLANKISKTVYHEESLAIKRAYLDDPFKKIIHKNSPLLDNGARQKHVASKYEEEDDPLDSVKLASIISGGICAGVILLLVLRTVCVGVIALVAPIFCPPSVIKACVTRWERLKECCERCKYNTNKHLLGAGRGKGKSSSLPV